MSTEPMTETMRVPTISCPTCGEHAMHVAYHVEPTTYFTVAGRQYAVEAVANPRLACAGCGAYGEVDS